MQADLVLASLQRTVDKLAGFVFSKLFPTLEFPCFCFRWIGVRSQSTFSAPIGNVISQEMAILCKNWSVRCRNIAYVALA